jgi:hypothetical protein
MPITGSEFRLPPATTVRPSSVKMPSRIVALYGDICFDAAQAQLEHGELPIQLVLLDAAGAPTKGFIARSSDSDGRDALVWHCALGVIGRGFQLEASGQAKYPDFRKAEHPQRVEVATVSLVRRIGRDDTGRIISVETQPLPGAMRGSHPGKFTRSTPPADAAYRAVPSRGDSLCSDTLYKGTAR